MKKILAFLMVVSTCSTRAQVYQWANFIGGTPANHYYTSEPHGKVSTIDAWNNIYVTAPGGYFKKFSPTGSLQWSKNIGGDGWSVTSDDRGYVYVIGNFTGAIDVDPSLAVYPLIAGGTDVFISKLDTAGDFVWAKSIGDTNSYNYGTDIKVDTAGNIYAVGAYSSYTDFDPGVGAELVDTSGAFLLKLDSSGNFLWVYVEKNSPYAQVHPFQYFNAVAVDDSGSVYVAMTGGNTTTTSSHLTKVDSNGNWLWNKYFPYSQISVGGDIYDLEISDSNYLFAMGLWDYKTMQYPGHFFIKKMDLSGNEIWTSKFSSSAQDWQGALAIDNEGNSYAIGSAMHGQFSPLYSGGEYFTCFGMPGMFVVKVNPSGTPQWGFIHEIGSQSTDDSYGYNIMVDDACGVYLTGYVQGSVDADPGPAVHTLSGTSLFLQKLLCFDLAASSVNGPENGSLIYPNPNTGSFTLSSTVLDASKCSIEIRDILGKLVYANTLQTGVSNFKTEINLDENIASGVYFLHLKTEGGEENIRFVKEGNEAKNSW